MPQLAVACLGAGVVTSLAVAQGQSPMTALTITLFFGHRRRGRRPGALRGTAFALPRLFRA